MEESATRVALYAREVALTEPNPEPALCLNKWDGLEKALESDAERVAVAFLRSSMTTGPRYCASVVTGSRLTSLPH